MINNCEMIQIRSLFTAFREMNVGQDKELNDLLDFSAVSILNVFTGVFKKKGNKRDI